MSLWAVSKTTRRQTLQRGYASTRVLHHQSPARDEYWRRIPRWSSVSELEFLSFKWQNKESVRRADDLYRFLSETMPKRIPRLHEPKGQTEEDKTVSCNEFISDVREGLKQAPMSTRLTAHILACINWNDAYNDPIRRQFLPTGSTAQIDHPNVTPDSLKEADDSPVPGLVHRYPDKVLFLTTSVCPVYCRFCTRSYAVGGETERLSKTRFLPILKKWEPAFKYIEQNGQVRDVVISGGDTFTLEPLQIRYIGQRLLDIPHIRRIRYASKGLSVCPSRFLDPDDTWLEALTEVSDHGRSMNKTVALHTHFNHINEITWITERASQELFQRKVTVRNQTVLLNGINNSAAAMKALIVRLGDCNIEPYYVYQGDMIPGLEELRTPLSDVLDIERQLRGSIAGFLMPSFIVDLPGGGGKRLATSYETYDKASGVATFKAPAVKGDRLFQYYDPIWSLDKASALQYRSE